MSAPWVQLNQQPWYIERIRISRRKLGVRFWNVSVVHSLLWYQHRQCQSMKTIIQKEKTGWYRDGCSIKKLGSPGATGLPAKLNPDWCRFLTGCLVGEVRAEAEGVPPRDMENSDTGPSYIPLGTALRTANCRTNRKNREGGFELDSNCWVLYKQQLWKLIHVLNPSRCLKRRSIKWSVCIDVTLHAARRQALIFPSVSAVTQPSLGSSVRS